MNKSMILVLLLIPTLANAQMPEGFDPAKMMEQLNNPAAMQKMAEQAEAAQKCMEGIDRSALEGLQKRAETATKEVENLCKAGKKAEALEKAISLSREMNGNATIKKLRECSKDMSEMMQSAPWVQMTQMPGVKEAPEPTSRDICS